MKMKKTAPGFQNGGRAQNTGEQNGNHEKRRFGANMGRTTEDFQIQKQQKRYRVPGRVGRIYIRIIGPYSYSVCQKLIRIDPNLDPNHGDI
jgi:hypothetical protein